MPLRCLACSTPCPEGTRFCLECGRPLALVCPSCDQPTVPGRFCGLCGSPLTSAPAPGPAAPVAAPGEVQLVAERRHTTVLFGDLVGFTTLAEDRDPEEVRELLSAYFAVARTVVERYGGTVEKFIGDAVMAVWGVPVAHEDDAERAVRAGIDLVSEVTALGHRQGLEGLAMRVGIVTGSVAVTLGATHEGMVAGDAVNTASRVQTVATPGEVWVDAETRGLAEAAIAFSDAGDHQLKGKAEPFRLYRADQVVAAVGGAQRVDGLQAPLTGRDADLRTLKEAFHATQQDGRVRVVTVSGMAGVGRSRLGWEFFTYIDGLSDGVFWHRGRCLSYGEGVAFWAFAEMIRSRLGIIEGDDRETVQLKTHAGVAAVAATEGEEAWLRPRVQTLVSGERGVAFDRTDLFAAWTTFLERVARDEPLVLVFEDMQHADSGLLDLVEHLLRTIRCRLFVLVLARPELLDRRPSLLAGRGAAHVELAPLAPDEMTTLVDGLVADLPRKARAALVTRSEGIPLYAVELVRSLIDLDAVVAREGRYVFVDGDGALVDLDRLSAPTSLQTLIAARLDTLTPVERRTVQDASVLGMTFRYESLLALSRAGSHELDLALDALVAKGVLETQTDPRSPEVGQFRFLQALVREVAYGTLTAADRRSRHLAVADRLTSEEREVPDALAGVVAQHLIDALAASPAQDPDRSAIGTRARALLVTAAARSESLGSPEEALASTEAALRMEPSPRERAELQERAARVARLAGRAELASELAMEAERGYLAQDAPVAAASAMLERCQALTELGRIREGRELGEQAARLIEGHDDVDPRVRTALHRHLAWCARALGDREEQSRHAFVAMHAAERAERPEVLLSGLNGLMVLLQDAGSMTASLAVLRHGIELAREHHLLDQLATGLVNLCYQLYPDDLAAATVVAAESVEASKRAADSYGTEVALDNASAVWWLCGAWTRLLAETEEWAIDREPSSASTQWWLLRARVQVAGGAAIDAPEIGDTEDPTARHQVVLLRALRLASAGDTTAAAALAAESSRVALGSGAVLEDVELWWSVAVELALAAEDVETAAELIERSVPLLERLPRRLTRGELPRLRGLLALARGQDPESDLRAAEAAHEAYGAPYLLARTRLALGRWLAGQGRSAEAQPLLAQAREAFVALRAEPSVAEVDALASVPTPAGAGGVER